LGRGVGVGPGVDVGGTGVGGCGVGVGASGVSSVELSSTVQSGSRSGVGPSSCSNGAVGDARGEAGAEVGLAETLVDSSGVTVGIEGAVTVGIEGAVMAITMAPWSVIVGSGGGLSLAHPAQARPARINSPPTIIMALDSAGSSFCIAGNPILVANRCQIKLDCGIIMNTAILWGR
jgi:hypothetical protein